MIVQSGVYYMHYMRQENHIKYRIVRMSYSHVLIIRDIITTINL